MGRRAQYKGLGIVVSATGLAAGATSAINYPTGLSDLPWVRSIVFYIQADKNWDLRLANGDGVVNSADYSVATGSAAPGVYQVVANITARAGKYLGFAIKNTDATAGNYTVRAELIGDE